MAREPIKIDGLKEFQKSVRKLEKGHRKQVRDAFKSVGDVIAVKARANAAATFDTTSHSGNLVKKIKSKSLARGVIVEASARSFHARKNKKFRRNARSEQYNYPGRLEFDPRLGSFPKGRENGRFLYLAELQNRGKAKVRLEEVLDWIETEFRK